VNVLVDTGAIVALLDRRDTYHKWAKKKVAKLEYPFYTCEAVLTESFHLLQPTHTGHDQLLKLLERELIQIDFNYNQYRRYVNGVITNYQNLSASFADACLVAMAEVIKNPTIFTLDDDFTIYRDLSGDPLPLIIPE
jgi:predicted nucleic acid-binding protein